MELFDPSSQWFLLACGLVAGLGLGYGLWKRNGDDR